MRTTGTLSQGIVNERPRVQLTRVFDVEAPDPNAPTYRFLNNVGQFHQVKIVTYNDDPDDAALTQAVLNRHPAGYIEFRDWAFETQWPSVAQYLTRRIREGRIQGVIPDDASVPMRCPVAGCEEIFPGTPEGRQLLAQHQFDHPVPTDDSAAAPQIITSRHAVSPTNPLGIESPLVDRADELMDASYAAALLEAIAERDASAHALAQLQAEVAALKEAADGGPSADQVVQHSDGRGDERRGSGDPAEHEGDPPVRDDAGDAGPVLPGDGERGAGGGRQHGNRAGGARRAGGSQGRSEPAA